MDYPITLPALDLNLLLWVDLGLTNYFQFRMIFDSDRVVDVTTIFALVMLCLVGGCVDCLTLARSDGMSIWLFPIFWSIGMCAPVYVASPVYKSWMGF